MPAWIADTLPPAIEPAAARTAAELVADAAWRDRAGGKPDTEAAILRRSGLLDLAINPDLDFLAAIPDRRAAIVARWETALAVVNRLARADLSAAALAGYTYMHQLRVWSAGDTPAWRRGVADALRSPSLWGGANNPAGPSALVVRTDGGYRISGRKQFATGSQVADKLVVGENLTEGGAVVGRITFLIDGSTSGLSHPDDWDGFGATRTASGSLVFDNVFVPDDAVFSHAPADPRQRSLPESIGSLAFQAMFVSFLVGSAQGAIETAIEVARAKRPDAAGRPDIHAAIGDAVARTSAALALGRQSARALGSIVADIELGTLTADSRAAAADVIAQSKVVAHAVSLDVTSAVFEAVGARGATETIGLDRFWRDARTYTLHDPVSVKRQEVGLYALLGTGATPSPNS